MNLIYFPNEIPNNISYSNLFFPSEKRTGNTLYQELSFQDSEALGDVDEGADITGEQNKLTKLVFGLAQFHFVLTKTRQLTWLDEFGDNKYC